MKTAPCKGCEKRELGCHGKCEAYKEFRKKYDEIIALKRSKEDSENWFAKRAEKFMRKRNRQQYR